MAQKKRGSRRPTVMFTRSESIDREAHAQPYDPFGGRLRAAGAGVRPPVTRRLKIYTQDPGTPRLDIAVGEALVPFEPLQAGPEGSVIRVIDRDEARPEPFTPVDLDALGVLAPTGVAPSTGNFHFAQQMTYAVAMVTYDRFRQALGRAPDFSFGPRREGEPSDGGVVKLHVYPHGMEEDNAYYDPERGALCFGYTYANRRALGMNQPGDVIYTSLSHDVVVHEMTHALLDGMRAKFMLPSNADVDAFHEGFADLVAVFQRFEYRDLVRRAIGQSPDLDSRLLTDVMRQWGAATGDDPRKALRSALVAAGGPEDKIPARYRYEKGGEAHDIGAVLVAAVFDAFRWIFGRKTASLRALAPGRDGRPSPELVDLLTNEACRLAGQFLNIIIRAIDYCPPVDLTFGEYLRAMVTADYDLVPDDPWGYREALVQAFRRYGITVDKVPDLSEESLLWRAPEGDLPPIPGLAFSDLKFRREPGQTSGFSEYQRRADALGEFITREKRLNSFGLATPVRGARGRIEPPVVESVRMLRRIGPDDSVNFDLVAEVTQRRRIRGRWFYGGATIIIDSSGQARYSIAKSVVSKRRASAFERFMGKKPALYGKLFSEDRPRTGQILQRLHRGAGRRS